MRGKIIPDEVDLKVGENEIFFLENNKEVIGISLKFKNHNYFITEEGYLLKVFNGNSYEQFNISRESFIELQERENEIKPLIDNFFINLKKVSLYTLNGGKFRMEIELDPFVKQCENFLEFNRRTFLDEEEEIADENWITDYLEYKKMLWIKENKDFFIKQESDSEFIERYLFKSF